MIKCIGCGISLQSETKERLGYVPKEKMGENVLCERCFRLQHYNDLQLVDLDKNEEVLKNVNESSSFAFFLVDLLNMNEEVMETYHRITIDKCLLVSKVDLLPKSLSYEKIKRWLQEVYGVRECLFLSAVKNYNVRGILRILEEKKKKEAFLLGYTNAGKSTLLNCFNMASITTSLVPNTTLDFIRIPLEEEYVLIDTPGFQYKNKLYLDSDLELIKKVNGKSRIRPLFYPLKKNASVVIENFIRIENQGETTHLIFYIPNTLKVMRLYEKNGFLKEEESVSFTLLKNEDLVFKGLGFVTCKNKAHLKVFVKNKEGVEKRKSFFE